MSKFLCLLLLVCGSLSLFAGNGVNSYAMVDLAKITNYKPATYNNMDSGSQAYAGWWYKELSLFYFCDENIQPVIVTHAKRDIHFGQNMCNTPPPQKKLLVQTGPRIRGIRAKVIAFTDSMASGVTYNAVVGVANGIADSRIIEKMDASTNKFVAHLSATGALGVGVLRDTVLGPTARQEYIDIRDAVIGPVVSNDIRHIIDASIGDSSAREFQRALRGTIDTTIGETTRNELKEALEAVGHTSNTQLKSLVDTMMVRGNKAGGSISERIKEIVHEASDSLHTAMRTVLGVLIAASVALLLFIILCGYLFHTRRKYSTVTDVLLDQIENMPENITLKEFKERIKKKADHFEVEDFLHKILRRKKMIHSELPHDNKKTE